jgi:hypothetical protein
VADPSSAVADSPSARTAAVVDRIAAVHTAVGTVVAVADTVVDRIAAVHIAVAVVDTAVDHTIVAAVGDSPVVILVHP